MVDCLCHLGVLPMKLIFGIALVLGLMMLGEGIALGVMIALLLRLQLGWRCLFNGVLPEATASAAGAKRRAGNAHESFSGNSMSAYRILGPGGAERRRPDALWAAVGPATQLQAGELVPLN